MTVGPRTRAALQSLGYKVERQWQGRTDHAAWDPHGRYITPGYAVGEDAAFADCLHDLKTASAEPLCSRMMAAIIEAEQRGDMKIIGNAADGYLIDITTPEGLGSSGELLFRGEGQTTHDAVLALFLRVCCDPEGA